MDVLKFIIDILWNVINIPFYHFDNFVITPFSMFLGIAIPTFVFKKLFGLGGGKDD